MRPSALWACQRQLSARAYHREGRGKLARTIADVAEAEQIGPAHLAETLQYRPRRMEEEAGALLIQVVGSLEEVLPPSVCETCSTYVVMP